MDLKFLDFEQPIAELEAKIDELRYVGDDSEININEEVARLKDKSESLTKSIFAKLSPWQVARVARHESRPYTQDYLDMIAPDFQELHGDRMYADDPAIIGGIGRIDGRAVMFIGHQKGRDTKERVRRNYGMPKPEGYRKAQRLDAHGREVFAADCDIYRYTRGLSGCWCGGARSKRGDRVQPVFDGWTEDTDYQFSYR